MPGVSRSFFMNREYTGIACTNVDKLRENVLISDISSVASLIEPAIYEGDAITPHPQLYRPSSKDLEPFLANEDTPINGLIEITFISNALKKHVADCMALQPTVCQPNQITTTQNTKNNDLRPGLHVDSREDLPLQDRMQSARRIGLNRGHGVRFLLVGSVNIFDIAEYKQSSPTDTLNTGDVREYARHALTGEAPPLRCLWIPLKPCMAYIAPTENIVHDGSTHGSYLGSTINFWVGGPSERGELGSMW
jgi:hypothetical protein